MAVRVLLLVLLAVASEKGVSLDNNIIRHIRCHVCKTAVQTLISEVGKVRSTKRIEEHDIQELRENICSPSSPSGVWITQIDVTLRNGRLSLENQGRRGRCRSECKSVARACEDTLGETEVDLEGLLFKGKTSTPSLVQAVCHDDLAACEDTDSLRGEFEDEVFEPMTNEDIEKERLMDQMKLSGIPNADMYSRQDLEGMMQAQQKPPQPPGRPRGTSFWSWLMECWNDLVKLVRAWLRFMLRWSGLWNTPGRPDL